MSVDQTPIGKEIVLMDTEKVYTLIIINLKDIKDGKCFKCGSNGHKIAECPKNTSEKRSYNDKRNSKSRSRTRSYSRNKKRDRRSRTKSMSHHSIISKNSRKSLSK